MAYEVIRIDNSRQAAAGDGRIWIDHHEEIIYDDRTYVRDGYTIDGVLSSDLSQDHFVFQQVRWGNDPKPHETMEPEPYNGEHYIKAKSNGIEVLCGDCHGSAFTLRYGSYEILAKCIACGKEACVYSG